MAEWIQVSWKVTVVLPRGIIFFTIHFLDDERDESIKQKNLSTIKDIKPKALNTIINKRSDFTKLFFLQNFGPVSKTNINNLFFFLFKVIFCKTFSFNRMIKEAALSLKYVLRQRCCWEAYVERHSVWKSETVWGRELQKVGEKEWEVVRKRKRRERGRAHMRCRSCRLQETRSGDSAEERRTGREKPCEGAGAAAGEVMEVRKTGRCRE